MFTLKQTRKLKRILIMKYFKDHHLAIPSIVILMLLACTWLLYEGLDWYYTLQLPWYTPSSWGFTVIWNIIYFLATISAIIFWDNVKEGDGKDIKWLYALNGLLNVSWVYLFFYAHMVGAALLISVLLFCTILLLMLLVWPVSKKAVLLLIPYLLWIDFAICLNYGVWTLN